MSQTIEWFTVEELRARRAALLSEAHVSLDELRAKRDAYLLDLRGQALLSDIEDIDYLLHGD